MRISRNMQDEVGETKYPSNRYQKKSEHKSGFLFLMRKPLDISALVSYNKTTKTAYLRRIFYTNVVMLPLGSVGGTVQVQVPIVRRIINQG